MVLIAGIGFASCKKSGSSYNTNPMSGQPQMDYQLAVANPTLFSNTCSTRYCLQPAMDIWLCESRCGHLPGDTEQCASAVKSNKYAADRPYVIVGR